MVIDDLDVMGVSIGPLEANPPLLIHPDGELARAISGQLLESIARRDFEVRQPRGCLYHVELPARHFANASEAPHIGTPKKGFSVPVPEVSVLYLKSKWLTR